MLTDKQKTRLARFERSGEFYPEGEDFVGFDSDGSATFRLVFSNQDKEYFGFFFKFVDGDVCVDVDDKSVFRLKRELQTIAVFTEAEEAVNA